MTSIYNSFRVAAGDACVWLGLVNVYDVQVATATIGFANIESVEHHQASHIITLGLTSGRDVIVGVDPALAPNQWHADIDTKFNDLHTALAAWRASR
jgi:hypothetical protein